MNIFNKRIIMLFMVVCITFTSVNANYEIAYATGLEELLIIPAVGGGATVGGVLLVVLAFVCLAAGIDYHFNHGQITGEIFDYLETTTGNVRIWWDNLKSVAINPDTGTFLGSDLANGIAVNIYDYIVSKGKNVNITQDVATSFAGFVTAREGWTEFKAGNISNETQVYKTILNSWGVVDENIDWTFMDYENIVFLRFATSKMIFVSNYPWQIYILHDASGGSTSSYQGIADGSSYKAYYYVNTSNIMKTSTTSDTYIRAGATQSTPQGMDVTDAEYIVCTNQELINDNICSVPVLSTKLMPGVFGIVKENVPASNYRYFDLFANTWKDQVLKINDYYIDGMAGTADYESTEEVIQAITIADNIARDHSHEIVESAVVATTQEIPLDTITDETMAGLDTAPSWLDHIINALKELLKWLFLPSDVAVADFVTHAETTMENKAGLLTYPLTLVIEFLLNVAQLGTTDCILKIPKIEFSGYVLYGGIDYNITQEIKQSAYAQMYSIYIMITNFIMIIAVLNLAVKKGDEIIRGN